MYFLWSPLGNHIICEYVLANIVQYISKGFFFSFLCRLKNTTIEI